MLVLWSEIPACDAGARFCGPESTLRFIRSAAIRQGCVDWCTCVHRKLRLIDGGACFACSSSLMCAHVLAAACRCLISRIHYLASQDQALSWSSLPHSWLKFSGTHAVPIRNYLLGPFNAQAPVYDANGLQCPAWDKITQPLARRISVHRRRQGPEASVISSVSCCSLAPGSSSHR